MKKIIIWVILLSIFSGLKSQSLKSYPRVKQAYAEKRDTVLSYLKKAGINGFDINIIIVGYKKERTLEVWAKKSSADTFKHLIDYKFCVLSGDLGPKRREGDRQVPEGFYYIVHYNPVSNFYLSLGLNYPNKSDRILGDKEHPGGNIYIHGSCVSIGCIPITDDKIKELFILALEAHLHGQKYVPVYIFPTKMTDENLKKISAGRDQQTIDFWKNIKQGYDIFQKNHTRLKYWIDNRGKYHFSG